MVVLTDALASLFKCEVNALQEHLNHPLAVNKVDAFMKDKRLRTTYLNRYGTKKEVKYTKLSLKSATQQEAYEGYLGISVRVHFYCRHRIRLLFPSLKCVSELNQKGNAKHYPIELLEIFADEEDNKEKAQLSWSSGFDLNVCGFSKCPYCTVY